MPVTNTDFHLCTGTLQKEQSLMCLTVAPEKIGQLHKEILNISYVTCGKITYNSTKLKKNFLFQS